jgi:hypothetical protein
MSSQSPEPFPAGLPRHVTSHLTRDSDIWNTTILRDERVKRRRRVDRKNDRGEGVDKIW